MIPSPLSRIHFTGGDYLDSLDAPYVVADDAHAAVAEGKPFFKVSAQTGNHRPVDIFANPGNITHIVPVTW